MKQWIRSVCAWLLAVVMLVTTSGATPIVLSSTIAYGDVDQDDLVNAADALLVLQHTVELIELDDEASLRADVSADGTINALDALLILQYAVKIITIFPAKELEPPPVIATIYFDTGAGTAVSPLTAEAGTAIEKPDDPVDPEHAFLGWLLDGEPYEFTTMPEQDITLTALWEGQHKIIFNTGVEGVTVPPIYAFPGESIQPPSVLIERSGYTLSGWMHNGQRFAFSHMLKGDVELMADWVPQTNLPSLLIELRGEDGEVYPLDTVDRENYISASYTFTNMPDGNDLHNVSGSFKGRGNGSWAAIKKGYRIKFDKKQSLFGLPKNKSWVLIACTNGDDQTLCRNYLAYNMAGALFDGIEYSTTARWVDLYVNGSYHGVYILTEKVQVDSGRVDIESNGDGDDMSFLVEYDAYAEGTQGIHYFRTDGVKYPFTVQYPEYEDYMEEEGNTTKEYQEKVAYMQDYVGRVYAAALGGDYQTLCELADIDSFVDMYILHEYFKNADTGWSSFFMYKKPGGKLYLGPPWDFDGTASISGRGDAGATGIYVADTINQTSAHTASELFYELYRTPEFFRAVQERWAVLSPQIKQYMNDTFTDEFYNENKAAMGRNFVRWNGRTQEEAEERWILECETIKDWFMTRANWLDQEWALDN